MPIAVNNLRPYRSLLLAACPQNWGLPAAINEIRQLAQNLPDSEAIQPASNVATRQGVRFTYFHYRIRRPPPWLSNQQVENILHELVVLFRRGTSVAILATERRLREQVFNRFDAADNTRLGSLSAIPVNALNSAYVRGKTKLLWLSGTHRSVPSLADNKTIAGTDLLYALDPLGDQSFFFTSAVSRLPQNAFQYNVGVSPYRSYIWAGPSEDATTLCQGVAQLFAILANAPAPNPSPLQPLAAPATSAGTVAAVAGPYEAALLPNELLDYDLPAAERAIAERWSRLVLDIVATNNADFDAELSLVEGDGTVLDLGQIHVAFDLTRPTRITWTATTLVAPAVANQQTHDDAVEIVNERRDWLKVWFESGHTLADQKFFVARLTDRQFRYTFANFANCNIKREKPSPLAAATINAQNSLFRWTKRRWRRDLPQAGNVSGWLVCNDGAMEIADFIHYEVVKGEAELTLIHVKAAKVKGAVAGRGLSVSDYEIVVGQAIKNLRFLDLQNTMNNFTAFLNQKLMNASWLNGVLDTRANMLAAMNAGGNFPRRRVVIVQPRVRQTALNQARAAPANSQQSIIAKQLDTLLLAAQASCQSVGAEFAVIADQA